MRLYRVAVAWLLSCFLVSAVRAESPPDPLRFLPREVDFCIKIEQPRKLVESAAKSDLARQLQAFDAVREALDSTNARRFLQLLDHFEKELGADRWELLDRLAGGGIATGFEFSSDSPRVLVVQAKDEKLLRQFAKVALDILDQELARQGDKGRVEKKAVQGFEIVHLGAGFHAGFVGSTLVVSNVEQGVVKALGLAKKDKEKSLAGFAQPAEARRLVGPDALGWAWLNLEKARKNPSVNDFITKPDPQLAVVLGGWLDVARRSPFLCAGIYMDEQGGHLSLRMPAGREGGTAPQLATHMPPQGQPRSRPLLEPKGVLFSTSYYLDVSNLWTARDKLFNDKQKKSFEDFDTKAGPFLAGTKLSKLLTEAGPYQRIVVANHAKQAYKTAPQQYVPSFGVVLEMREPEAMGKQLEAILRAAGLLATTQVKLKLFEETYGQRKIVGYHFAEDDKPRFDTNNIRLNFTPCFVAVGNQFVVCSDVDLCRQLIDLLDKEQASSAGQGSPATAQTRFYAAGAAALIEAFKDRFFTQIVLDQAVPPDRASEQLRAFIDWVRQLGVVQLESIYGAHDFHYDIRLQLARPH